MILSDEIKAQLIADIEKGDEAALRGMMETLKIVLGNNPNIIPVELTLSQLEYLDTWGKKLSGTGPDTLIRMMVDKMMQINPLKQG